MEITPDELRAQVDGYLAVYPWVWDVDTQFGLPRGLMLAVGSRETNLILGYADGSLVGDGGYGHGTWQEDNHPQNANPERDAICARIQSGDNVYAAQTAGAYLRNLLDRYGNIDGAADAYNDGSIPYDYATTGHDYGSDVAERCGWIAGWYLTGQFGHHTTPTIPDDHADPDVPAVRSLTEDEDLMEFLIETKGAAVKARPVARNKYPAVGPRQWYVVDPAQNIKIALYGQQVPLYLAVIPEARQFIRDKARDCAELADVPSR